MNQILSHSFARLIVHFKSRQQNNNNNNFLQNKK